MKNFWDRNYRENSAEADKRDDLIKKFLKKFYEKIKNNPNVMSGEEVYKKYQSTGFFTKSFWNYKTFLSYLGNANDDVFGLKSGICYRDKFLYFITGKDKDDYFSITLEELTNIKKNDKDKIEIIKKGLFEDYILKFGKGVVSYRYTERYTEAYYSIEDINIIKQFIIELNKTISVYLNKSEKLKEKKVKMDTSHLITLRENFIYQLDKNGDGKVDLVENDFNKLLTKNQKLVINIDRNYIHQFIKVSNYIKTKKENIQIFFQYLNKIESKDSFEESMKLLKNQIYTYDLLMFHSISMVTSLVDDDMITFYEIYESFDKLRIFNSNWENEVSEKLSFIGDNINELMYSIYQMETKIVNEISNLSYVTQSAFQELNKSVENQLSSIDSSIKFNNLLTGIQTYQMYKINKNTKKLN